MLDGYASSGRHVSDLAPPPSLRHGRPPLVLVMWEDITNTAEWGDAAQIKGWQHFEFEHVCFSVGYLVHDAEDHIILAAQVTADFKAMAMASRIPKGVIKSMVVLTEPQLGDCGQPNAETQQKTACEATHE